jgi:hypothetical protein
MGARAAAEGAGDRAGLDEAVGAEVEEAAVRLRGAAGRNGVQAEGLSAAFHRARETILLDLSGRYSGVNISGEALATEAVGAL